MSTSQASLEMTVLLALALIFLGFVQAFYVGERNSTMEESLALQARQVAADTAAAIDGAYLSGEGFSANFTLPQRIGSYYYNLTVSGGHVYVVLQGFSLSVSAKTLPAAVYGSPRPGRNTISNRGGGNVSVG